MKIRDYVINELSKNSKNKVSINTNISELPIDSLDLVEMVVNTEEKFKLSIPDEKLEEMQNYTVAQIISLFEKSKK